MKNRNFIKNSILLLLPISMGIGVLFGTANKHINSTSAYTGVSLPTTIKLNDPDESKIRSYYADLNSLDENERKGDNLLKNLKTILSNGQKYYNYDSGDLVWKMYEITDRDWDMSPASSTTYGTYNASTNTITNYQYGNNSTPKNNPYVRAYYMDRGQTNVVKAWGNHNQNATGINREHLWAKAEGFDGDGAAGARGDPMHLVAANGYANNIHSNHFYGYVDKTKSYTDVKNTHSTLGHNYSGYSKTYPSSSVTVFEPQDCDKGDIARAIFYMAARYNNIAGKTASQETFDADNPNLLLTNDLSKWKSGGYTSTATSPGYHGLITDLLEWNRIDKPDAYEIHRNNLLYTNFTNNRNPFIDFPEWADYIWGDQSAIATPATDTLNGSGGGTPTVTVTSIEITEKPTKLVYNSGESLDLTGMSVKANKSDGTSQTLNSTQYTVTPTGALKTSDTEVVVSYSGKSASFAIAVKSSGGGSTEVIAPAGTTLLFEPFTGFAANVLPTSPGTSSSVYNSSSVAYTCNKGSSDTKIYNESLATGEAPEILVSKSNGSFVISNVPTGGAKEISICYKANKTVSLNCSSSDYTVSGSNKNYKLTLKEGSVAPSTINLTFLNSSTKDNCRVDDIEIKVVTAGEASQENVDVSSIVLNENALSLEIGASEKLIPTISPDNATIKLVSWSSSDPSVVEVSDDGDITAKSAGNAVITCSALDGSGVTATCSVTVNEPITLQSISLSGDYATEFYLNDEFSNTGMIVTAHYSDGTSVDVSDEAECSGFDSSTTGTKTITVSYDGISTTYSVTVKEARLEDNQRLFVASKSGTGSGEPLGSYTDSPITVAFSKKSGSNPPKYNSTTQSFRVYAGNTFTITGTKKITKIEFEMASSDEAGSNTISANVGSLSGTTWTGNESSVVFTVGGTSGQRNIVSIKVTYDENSQEIAALSSISLSGTYKTEFFKGDTFSYSDLIVTAHYSDNTEKIVTPTSVSTPTTTTSGTKTVTVSYTENNITKEASYNIEVIAVVGVSIELTGTYKTDYKVGDEFSTSRMTVVEHKNNGATANHLPSSCTFTGYDLSSPGDQTVTVDYQGLTTTYTIHVTGVAVKTYVATILPSDFTTGGYNANNGEHTIVAVNASNSEDTRNITIVTSQVYQNSNAMQWQKNTGFLYNSAEIGNITSVVIDSSGGTFYTCFGNSAIDTHQTENSSATSGKYFNVSVDGATGTTKSVVITFTVTEGGSEKELSSIAISGDYKTSFNVGDEFEFGGTVTATYSDNTEENVTDLATFSGYDLSTTGEQTVTVTYGEKTATYNITVESSTPSGKISTIGKTMSEIVTENEYSLSSGSDIGTKTEGFSLDDCVSVAVGKAKDASGNTGSFWGTSPNIDMRLYENDVPQLTIQSIDGYKIKTVKITYSNKDNGVLKLDTENILSNQIVNVDGESITFGVSVTSGTKAGQVRVTAIEVVYEEIVTPQNYSLVTDVSDLRTGDKIVIVAPNTSLTTYYSLSTNRNIDSTIYGCEIDFNNNIVTPSDETELITVERNGNDLSFKLSDGKYLASTQNFGHIDLADSSSDLSARFIATTNTDGTNSIKLISENTNHIGRRLKFNYNGGSRFYRCYTTDSTTGVDPMIFKYQPQVEADTWAKDFLENTEFCDLSNWSSLARSYSQLSKAAKEEIYSVVSDPSTDMNYRAQAMARYEKTLSVNKSADAFISEREVNLARPISLPIVAPNKETILIVVFALIGVSAIGGYYFIKRKKEDFS